MKLTIDIDDSLMNKAKELSGIKTKKDVVNAALKLYVALKSQEEIGDLYGKIQIDDVAFQ